MLSVSPSDQGRLGNCLYQNGFDPGCGLPVRGGVADDKSPHSSYIPRHACALCPLCDDAPDYHRALRHARHPLTRRLPGSLTKQGVGRW